MHFFIWASQVTPKAIKLLFNSKFKEHVSPTICHCCTTNLIQRVSISLEQALLLSLIALKSSTLCFATCTAVSSTSVHPHRATALSFDKARNQRKTLFVAGSEQVRFTESIAMVTDSELSKFSFWNRKPQCPSSKD